MFDFDLCDDLFGCLDDTYTSFCFASLDVLVSDYFEIIGGDCDV